MPPKMGPSAPVTSTISGRASRGPVPVAMSGTSPRQGPQRETPSTPISPTSDTLLLRHRLTGTAVQLSWELRTGRGRRTTSTQVHFGQLEVLECLWPRDTSEPEYTEVRTESRCAQRSLQLPAGLEAQPDFGLLCPVTGPQLPQQPRFPGLSSALCPPASYTDSPPGVQGNPPHPTPWLFPASQPLLVPPCSPPPPPVPVLSRSTPPHLGALGGWALCKASSVPGCPFPGSSGQTPAGLQIWGGFY